MTIGGGTGLGTIWGPWTISTEGAGGGEKEDGRAIIIWGGGGLFARVPTIEAILGTFTFTLTGRAAGCTGSGSVTLFPNTLLLLTMTICLGKPLRVFVWCLDAFLCFFSSMSFISFVALATSVTQNAFQSICIPKYVTWCEFGAFLPLFMFLVKHSMFTNSGRSCARIIK